MKKILHLVIATIALTFTACATPVTQPQANNPGTKASVATPTTLPTSPSPIAPTFTSTAPAPTTENTITPSPTKTSALAINTATATIHASRVIFSSPNRTPLAWAQLMVQNVKLSNTSYQHKDNSVLWAGINGATDYTSFADCSGFVNALLTQSYGLSTEDFLQWLGSKRPLAKDYFTAVENKRGFQRIINIANMQAGDLIAIRYNNSAPGDNTGHVLIAAANPQQRKASNPIVNNTQQWDVTIIDSSESGHGKDDTRRLPDGTFHDGVGRGTMRLYTDNSGMIVGYTWSDLNDSTFYDSTARPIVVGRIDPKFSLP